MNNFGSDDKKTALQAKYDAQKIAFAPIVFQATLALRDLGILNALYRSRKAGKSLVELTSELEIAPYGIRVLLDAGLGAEVVTIDDDGKYRLTKTGYFITTDNLTKVNMNFVADVCYNSMSHLKDSIIEEKPSGLKELGPWDTIYEGLTQLPDKASKSWFEFDHFYSDNAFDNILPIIFSDKPRLLLDVGGNTGKWAIKCFEYDPNINVTIIDLPLQLEKATVNVTEAGFEDRFATKAIDLLQDGNEFVSGADCIWMSQFLDCFSTAEITRILSRARSHMEKDTRLFVLELFWDRQRFDAAAFSLVNISLYFTCIANGNSKMYHSDEFKQCAEDAGLVLHKQTDQLGIGHTLLEYRIPALPDHEDAN